MALGITIVTRAGLQPLDRLNDRFRNLAVACYCRCISGVDSHQRHSFSVHAAYLNFVGLFCLVALEDEIPTTFRDLAAAFKVSVDSGLRFRVNGISKSFSSLRLFSRNHVVLLGPRQI